MSGMICPPWLGYFLLSPFRKWLENPDRMLPPFVSDGMIVLEPGCGMGYFTLPLARMVGPGGRVVAVDIQPKMLEVLEKRAIKAGLGERVETRELGELGPGLEDLSEKVDLCVILHMLHEVPDQVGFLKDIWQVLKPGGRILIVEPKGHVSERAFRQSIGKAEEIGFISEPVPGKMRGRKVILSKAVT